MHRYLADDVAWIHNCIDTGEYHMHFSQYLIQGATTNILVDAGTEMFKESTLDEIQQLLDGEPVDHVLLTNTILPHTEQLPRIEQRWPDVDVISSTNAPAFVGLQDARPKVLNDSREFGTRTVSFLDPLLTDITGTNWIYDRDSKVLITAEGLGHYHTTGHCNDLHARDERRPSLDCIQSFYRDKLPYLEYVDGTKLRRGIEELRNDFEIDVLAPIHGNPVRGGTLDAYFDLVVDSVERMGQSFDARPRS